MASVASESTVKGGAWLIEETDPATVFTPEKLNDEHKPHFILEPHLTIARKLLPWQYERGWQEYSHKHFTGRFIADAMLLLKRPVRASKYEIARRFEFENLPVVTKQGELFG
jgi:hypothetical protein